MSRARFLQMPRRIQATSDDNKGNGGRREPRGGPPGLVRPRPARGLRLPGGPLREPIHGRGPGAETFLAGVRTLRASSPTVVSVAWLVGVARHKLADHWRREARGERLLHAIGAAASGRAVAPSVRLYLAVAAIGPVVAKIEELGGHAGPVAEDMGPYLSVMCTDDQGTESGLISDRLADEPPLAPTLTPSLACDDAHGLIRWLVDLLEFQVAEPHEEPGGGVAHAVLSWRTGNLFISARHPGRAGPSTICLAKDDPAEIDRLYQKALAANAEVVQELTDADYGSHEFGLRDPEGNLWAIGTYRPSLAPGAR